MGAKLGNGMRPWSVEGILKVIQLRSNWSVDKMSNPKFTRPNCFATYLTGLEWRCGLVRTQLCVCPTSSSDRKTLAEHRRNSPRFLNDAATFDRTTRIIVTLKIIALGIKTVGKMTFWLGRMTFIKIIWRLTLSILTLLLVSQRNYLCWRSLRWLQWRPKNPKCFSGLKLEKNEAEGGLVIKASRKLDHYVLKPTLEKLLNRGNGYSDNNVSVACSSSRTVEPNKLHSVWTWKTHLSLA
jgi:hypothetical protein